MFGERFMWAHQPLGDWIDAVCRQYTHITGHALRFDAATASMESTRKSLSSEDPVAAATLDDALDMIRRDGVGGQVRDVGRALSQNRMGQAVDQQETVIGLLGQLQDILANRREYQLDRTIERLEEVAGRLDQIQARQRVIRQQIEGSRATTSEQFRVWEQQEGAMAQQVEGLARQLQRQVAEDAESALRAASTVLRQASQAADAEDLARTRQESKNAEYLLDEARREIEVAKQSGASLGPFLAETMQTPAEPTTDDTRAWDTYAGALMERLASWAEYGDADVGPLVLAVKSGARGSLRHLATLIGTGSTVLRYGSDAVRVSRGFRDGLSPPELFAWTVQAREAIGQVALDVSRLWQDVHRASAPTGCA